MATSYWTDASLEPKRNFRWRVTIPSLQGNGGNVIWWVKNFKAPSYDISEVTHSIMDNKFNFPGRLTWTDCSMTMVDPVSPNAVQLTNDIIIQAGYSTKSLNSFQTKPTTMSKRRSVTATGNVVVEVLNSDGNAIEKWTLFNPWIKSATFSELSYESDDLRTIDIAWKYDWAECENFDHSGAVVGVNPQFKPM
jgi:hypothetical protein